MKRQRGVTFVGMIFIAGLIIMGAIIALKLVPAYIEYFTIKRVIGDIASGSEVRGGTLRDATTAFQRRAQIDDIRAVTAQDIDVVREGDSVVLSASYQTKVKLFGNLSACIDFEPSSGK